MFAPRGVAVDAVQSPRHLYVADSRNHRVLAWQDARSFQNGGAPTIILGQPGPQSSGPLGIGAKGFTNPSGLAVDPKTGNLYVADTGNSRVLRFLAPFSDPTRSEPDAVYGQPDFSTQTPGTTDHSLNGPQGVAFDADGSLWVADTQNSRVLRFPSWLLDSANPSADLIIGQADFSGGSPNHGTNVVSASGFDRPVAIAFDIQGNLYVSDSNNLRVLRFTPPFITSQAASAALGQRNLTSRTVAVTASASTMSAPAGLAVSAGGALYVAVPGDNRVLAFTAAATLPSSSAATGVFGQTDFTGTLANVGVSPRASAATLSGAFDVKVDPDGDILVADTGNNRVLAIPPNSPAASRVWGQPDFTANGPNQVKPGSVNAVYKVAIDYSASPFALYVSDTGNNRVLIWKDSINFRTGAPADLVIGQPDGNTAYANVDGLSLGKPSRTSLSAPRGIALDASGALYVADGGNNRLLRFPRPVNQSGRISPDVVIGQRDFTSSDSAVVTASSLNHPAGVAIGPNGNIFVADSGNNRVLEFPSGVGSGASASRVYGQPDFSTRTLSNVSALSLNNPQGLWVDASSNLYVVDSGSNRVLIFPDTKDAPPTGSSASIVIGQSDFIASSAGVLRGPLDVTADSSGQLYVSDTGNNRVLVFPSLLFLSLAGASPTAAVGQPSLTSVARNWNSRDGLATPEGLSNPAAVYMDRQDTLYAGDTGNNRVVHFLKQAGVVNATHFMPNVPVAPGTLVSLFGPALASGSAAASDFPLPGSMLQRQVVINDEITAPLLFLSPTQINFELPGAAPPGTQRIAVRVADTGELIAGGSIGVANSSPGFFSRGGDGKGQAVALNEDGKVNGVSNPAPRGSVIQLFGTGQGPVSPQVPDGMAAPSGLLSRTLAIPTSDGQTCLITQPSVCVAIGSTFGETQYSGLAPGFAGLWQVNVKIPQSAPVGSAVPIRAVVNGTPSNIVTVAIR